MQGVRVKCPNIGKIHFSSRSIQAIEEIRRLRQAADQLATLLGAGIMVNLFAGQKPLEAAYAIYEADFEAFAKAMHSIPAILKRRIRDEADRAWLSVSDYQEKTFWQAISVGCELP